MLQGRRCEHCRWVTPLRKYDVIAAVILKKHLFREGMSIGNYDLHLINLNIQIF